MPTTTKRRKKQWWQMLRGPRGHRGLPGRGEVSSSDFTAVAGAINEELRTLRERVDNLERKLGGPWK